MLHIYSALMHIGGFMHTSHTRARISQRQQTFITYGNFLTSRECVYTYSFLIHIN